MLLAELEIRHSRPIAPTRRVAIGELFLPTEPPPGFGGVLLAGIVAAFSHVLDEEGGFELDALIDDLEREHRISQPRLRHRLQVDTIGLDRSCHKLVGAGEAMALEIEDKEHPMPQLLGATYAAGRLSYKARPAVFRLLRKARHWQGGTGPDLVTFLTGDEAAYKTWRSPAQDEVWALEVLGFDDDEILYKEDVTRRYRDLVRAAHPDNGGDPVKAGPRINDLTEARRILLEGE